MVIDPKVKELWERDRQQNPNTPELDQFLDHAVELAAELFPRGTK